MSWSGQLQVVQDNFAVFDTAAEGGKADGKISREDLTAVACGAVPASPEARQTASLWLENPTLWQGLNPDGKLTRDDLTRARQKVVDNGSSLSGQPGGQQNWSQTLAALEGNFSLLDTAGKGGKGDGKVSRQDLQAVLDSGCASPEVRAAAQALLANPTLFDSLEGNGDGLFSQKDVKRARELAGGPGTAP